MTTEGIKSIIPQPTNKLEFTGTIIKEKITFVTVYTYKYSVWLHLKDSEWNGNASFLAGTFDNIGKARFACGKIGIDPLLVDLT